MSARIRDVRLGPFGLVAKRRPDGTIYARSPHPLGQHPSRLTERLEHWAERAPERTFLARRDDAGGWRRLTYARALD
ncbi:MAG: feruloyl-CoA synthase, partial [Geminicoccaceae bacterium]